MRFKMITMNERFVYVAQRDELIRAVRTAAKSRVASFVLIQGSEGIDSVVTVSVLEAWVAQGRVATIGQLPSRRVGRVNEQATLGDVSKLMSDSGCEVIAMTRGEEIITLLARSHETSGVDADPRLSAA